MLPDGILAHAFYPKSGRRSGDVHFDDDEEWTDGTKEGDFESTRKMRNRLTFLYLLEAKALDLMPTNIPILFNLHVRVFSLILAST